jgi:hypothetical protein
MGKLGSPITDAEAEAMLSEVDFDDDGKQGKVHFGELLELMNNGWSLIACLCLPVLKSAYLMYTCTAKLPHSEPTASVGAPQILGWPSQIS